jgi:hypothetical protein
MHPDAAAGWCMMSKTPCTFLVVFFVCYALTILGFGSIYILGLRQSLWFPYVVIPASVYVPIDIIMVALFWYYGPVLARSDVITVLSSISGSLLLLTGMVAHISFDLVVPFGSKLFHTLALFPTLFAANMVLKLAREPSEHPSKPHANLLPPLLGSAIKTVRMMDALTDIGIVDMLARKVSSDLPGESKVHGGVGPVWRFC